jgi:hypothetical protein
MRDTFSRDSQFKQFNLDVTKVQVFKQSKTKYQGLATVVYDGMTHDVPVDITVDGKNVMWKTDPGSFSFIAQKQLEKLQSIFR